MLCPSPKAVIFDMDGTLLDTETVARRAWSIGARDTGIDLSQETIAGFTGRNGRDIARQLEQLIGSSETVAKLRTLAWEAYEAELERGIELKPGVEEFLFELEAEGIPSAVATSSGKSAAISKLGNARILHKFRFVIGGDEVTSGKPNPEIFQVAASRLAVPSLDCWAFEDSPLGLEAAHAAEMRAFMIPDLVEPTEHCHRRAFKVMESFHVARSFLVSLLRR